MFGIDNFLTFLIAGILLNITPGSDTMYVLGRSIAQGRSAGFYSALGIFVGCFFHILLAAFGLSLIIQKSQLVFNIIKYIGATYLCYLGAKMLITKEKANLEVEKSDNLDLRKIFYSGVLTNILNPKVALFFIAFLPQFVDKSYENPAISFLILGITFDIIGTLWLMILAYFASTMAVKIKQNHHITTWIDRVVGAMFFYIGVKLFVEKN